MIATRSNLAYCFYMERYALKRLLERLGFVHIAGWVRNEDAPRIRAKIEAAKPAISEAIKGQTGASENGENG